MPDSIVRRITWRTADIARILTLGIFFFFLWRFFWMVYTALFIVLIAVLLAIVLHAPSKFLARWIPFWLSFPFVVMGFLAALAGVMIAVIPQILDQVSQLAGQLPAAMDNVTFWIEERTGSPRDGQLAQTLDQQLADFVGRFVPLAFNLVSALIGFFAVLILAIFLAMQPGVYRELLLRMAPPGGRERAARIYDEAGRNLRNWVLGKAVTMIAVGLATYVGLLLFKIPGALALGALAAVLEFIPNLGPTIAAVPAVISAFLISPLTALYVAIFYFVLQQIQSALTVPLVEQRAVNIPPAALLIWQIMLTVGFGILGLFVATPLLAVLVVATRILYVEPTEERYASDRRESAQAAATHPSAPLRPDQEPHTVRPTQTLD